MNDEQTAEIKELERSLCALPDVEAVRVVVDDKGRPAEIHVVVTALKEPKRVSRDIHSFALASLGIDLDRRIISVVQNSAERIAPDQPSATAAIEGRPTIGAIETRTAGARTSVQVVLTRGGAEGAGTADRVRIIGNESSPARHGERRCITEARIRGRGFRCRDRADRPGRERGSRRRDAGVCRSANRTQLLAGAAIVTADHDQAIVRAVLDATNRRLPFLARRWAVGAP